MEISAGKKGRPTPAACEHIFLRPKSDTTETLMDLSIEEDREGEINHTDQRDHHSIRNLDKNTQEACRTTIRATVEREGPTDEDLTQENATTAGMMGGNSRKEF